MIPVVIKTNDKILAELLDRKNKSIDLERPEWFKINHGQTGFYRVKYSEKDLSKLKGLVSKKILDPINRWGIQNDLFKLCRNGEIIVDKYLDFIQSYKNEDSYLVLASIYQSMRTIQFVFVHERFWSHIWPEFKEIYRQTFRRILDNLGWAPREDENQKDTLLRELAIRYLGFAEDVETLKIVARNKTSIQATTLYKITEERGR